MHITVWACPTEGCGNHYASSGAGDLSTQIVGQRGMNFEPTPERERPRAHCPDCWARGKLVMRRPIAVQLETTP